MLRSVDYFSKIFIIKRLLLDVSVKSFHIVQFFTSIKLRIKCLSSNFQGEILKN